MCQQLRRLHSTLSGVRRRATREASKRFANIFVQNGKHQKEKALCESILKSKKRKVRRDVVELLWVLLHLSEMYYGQFHYDEFYEVSERFHRTSEKCYDSNNCGILEAFNSRNLSYIIGGADGSPDSSNTPWGHGRFDIGSCCISGTLIFHGTQLTKAKVYTREVINSHQSFHGPTVFP